MWDCEAVVSEKQVSEPVKPVLQLSAVAGRWSLSPAGLLSLESEFAEEIKVS